MRDYQESVTTWQTDRRTDRQTPDKVIPMSRYAPQATQKRLLDTLDLLEKILAKYHDIYVLWKNKEDDCSWGPEICGCPIVIGLSARPSVQPFV